MNKYSKESYVQTLPILPQISIDICGFALNLLVAYVGFLLQAYWLHLEANVRPESSNLSIETTVSGTTEISPLLLYLAIH